MEAQKIEKLNVVKDVIKDMFMIEEEITPETTLFDLGMDSLDFVELTMELEKRFDKIIPDGELENVKNIGDLLKLL